MAEVQASSGYQGFADPKNNGNSISSCTQQEANEAAFKLNIKGSLNSDPITMDLDIIQSQGTNYYVMDNMYGCGCGLEDARNVQLSQPMVNFEGGKGWIGEKGCLVDTDSQLRENKDRLTNQKYIHQLTERPHLTTGNLVRGYHNVDVESIIQNGIDTHSDMPCNNLSGVFIGNQYTPMIPKLQEEVQNPVHIIPEDSMDSWVRGGLPTRQMQRNQDYLRRCQEKTYSSQ